MENYNYSTGEAAKLLDISFPTLKRWIYSGRIKAMKAPSGRWRIPDSEIKRLRGYDVRLRAELITIAKIAAQLLEGRFGDLIVKIVLFGSVARGDVDRESDVDLLLVVRDGSFGDYFDMISALTDAVYDTELATGRPVNLVAFTQSEFEEAKASVPLIWDAMREGMEL